MEQLVAIVIRSDMLPKVLETQFPGRRNHLVGKLVDHPDVVLERDRVLNALVRLC